MNHFFKTLRDCLLFNHQNEMECVKKLHCNKYIHFKIASNAKVTKNVTSLLENILVDVHIIKEKGCFKVNSKLEENSRNHIFHILTTLGSV